MQPSEWTRAAAVVTVVTVLLASGPLAGGVVHPGGTPTVIGDGNATVATVDVPYDDIYISPGRFGTNVSYLRIPGASVDVAEVTDRPRLIYRVRVQGLDADRTATRIVTEQGSYRLHVRDVALAPGVVTNESYDATVEVRVQSFTGDHTVVERRTTVQVRR